MFGRRLTALFVLVAVVAATLFDHLFGTVVDYWIHDIAVIFQARTQWKHVALITLDDRVPIKVGRKEALPLYALAADRLAQAGAKGLFLDARLPKEVQGVMPYALCMAAKGEVKWSAPRCVAQPSRSCALVNSVAGSAPLKMSSSALTRFRLAPYLQGQEDLPDMLLFDWDALAAIPAEGLVSSDRLVTKRSPIARWMDLSPDHAAIRLAHQVLPETARQSLAIHDGDETCDDQRRCRRIRQTRPLYHTNLTLSRLILPLSELAACEPERASKLAALAKDKAVILQMTGPAESTDNIVTPMTAALFGPHLMTPGPQFLGDAVETLLAQDHPRAPAQWIKLLLFIAVSVLAVIVSMHLRQSIGFVLGLPVFAGMIALCLFNPSVQLWPVTATMIAYVLAVSQSMGLFMVIGLREGKLIRQYMPRQVHNLLIALRKNRQFLNRRHRVIVLMTDLAGYTTVTGLLREPSHVLALMNDYLQETSFVLQRNYDGWLESYVGDMVCYYWPFADEDQQAAYHNALQGALELAKLQKQFFSSVRDRYQEKFTAEVAERIGSIIDAGIGLASGVVVMGDMGPREGVRKFGILGEPLNVASRVESLTRQFNTDIIVTGDFAQFDALDNAAFRYLGRVILKGRIQPEALYALGSKSDERFGATHVEAWRLWISSVESGSEPTVPCPEIFALDRRTILKWKDRRLLSPDGAWHLDEK